VVDHESTASSSRRVSSRAALTLERVDLSRLARDATDRLANAEPERAVAIDIEPDLVVDMDATLARAVVDNLVDNAWKFSARTPGAHIEIGATVVDGARTFFVRDNGAGFDMAYAKKLFVPFQRLHTASEFPGTGVGLATVQRIVLRHGGRIWAENITSGGARFTFTLPLLEPPAMQVPDEPVKEATDGIQHAT
jgi:light-regulated signal transduction histidine kinase (bacteriophytochrome)